MMSSKIIYCIIIFLLLVTNCCFAQSLEDGKIVFANYFDCYKKADFQGMAKYMYKADLDNLRDVLLPIIIKLAESENNEKSQVGYSILKVDKGEWNNLSSEQFFVLFSSVVMAKPGFQQIMSEFEVKITDAYYKSNQTDMVIEYVVVYRDIELKDNVSLINVNNTWYLRLKQDPLKFQAIFNKLLEE